MSIDKELINKVKSLSQNERIKLVKIIMDIQVVPKEKHDLTFPAQIELIEMLGNEYLIYAFYTITQQATGKATFSIKTSEKSTLNTNSQIEASIDLSKAHFFDKNTEKAIL